MKIKDALKMVCPQMSKVVPYKNEQSEGFRLKTERFTLKKVMCLGKECQMWRSFEHSYLTFDGEAVGDRRNLTNDELEFYKVNISINENKPQMITIRKDDGECGYTQIE